MRVRRSKWVMWTAVGVGIVTAAVAISALKSMQQNGANQELYDNLYHGSAAEVAQALDAGADPDAVPPHGSSGPGEALLHLVTSLFRRDSPPNLTAVGQAINGLTYERERRNPAMLARLRPMDRNYFKGLCPQPQEKVRVLLEHHADPNRCYGQVTPLVEAVQMNDPETVRLLLAFHADPTLKGANGLSAQAEATRMQNAPIQAMLADAMKTSGTK